MGIAHEQVLVKNAIPVANRHIENAQKQQPLGKCNPKPQTTSRFYHSPLRTIIMQKLKAIHYGENVGKREFQSSIGWNVN